jgi:hypothetical protein
MGDRLEVMGYRQKKIVGFFPYLSPITFSFLIRRNKSWTLKSKKRSALGKSRFFSTALRSLQDKESPWNH